MHETRNFLLTLLVAAAAVWTVVAWLFLDPGATLLATQRVVAPIVLVLAGVWLIYGLYIEEKLPDHLKQVVGPMYYEADGLSFMPMVRARGDRAELCVYYQNRYENPVQAIIHLRPPEDSFIIQPGMRDVHFAFKAAGGDFGMIHQPIAVPSHLQGEVIDVQLAAASFYPRGHGTCMRRHAGMPCGTMLVDWAGAAFKTGVHEVSGEMELRNPVTLHLSMPPNVATEVVEKQGLWKQQCIQAGALT